MKNDLESKDINKYIIMLIILVIVLMTAIPGWYAYKQSQSEPVKIYEEKANYGFKKLDEFNKTGSVTP